MSSHAVLDLHDHGRRDGDAEHYGNSDHHIVNSRSSNNGHSSDQSGCGRDEGEDGEGDGHADHSTSRCVAYRHCGPKVSVTGLIIQALSASGLRWSACDCPGEDEVSMRIK